MLTAPVLAIPEDTNGAGGNTPTLIHIAFGKKVQFLATWAAHDTAFLRVKDGGGGEERGGERGANAQKPLRIQVPSPAVIHCLHRPAVAPWGLCEAGATWR